MTTRPPARRATAPAWPSGQNDVDRRTYRQRRLSDAARALPVLALFLWWVPLLWTAPGSAVSASSVLVYVFGTWVALAVAAGLVIHALRRGTRKKSPGAGR